MDNIQDRLAQIKRMIRDAKTAHDMKSNMQTYHMAITIPQYASYNTISIIAQYADGTQPIMTTVTGDLHIIPCEPVGNTQRFVFAERKGSLVSAQNAYFLSTRRILSLVIE